MSSIFYDHLVDWPAAEAQLKALTSSEEEHYQLSELLDQTTHHEIFTVILMVLPKRAHATFLKQVQKEPHGAQHLALLRVYDPTIDQKLQQVALDSHRKFFDAIHQADVIP